MLKTSILIVAGKVISCYECIFFFDDLLRIVLLFSSICDLSVMFFVDTPNEASRLGCVVGREDEPEACQHGQRSHPPHGSQNVHKW